MPIIHGCEFLNELGNSTKFESVVDCATIGSQRDFRWEPTREVVLVEYFTLKEAKAPIPRFCSFKIST